MSKYSATVLEKGPAAYWRLNDTNALMVDHAGVYTGSYTNAPSYGFPSPIVGDEEGASVVFNGTNEGGIASCPPITTNSFAVELWMKPETYDTGVGGASAFEMVGGTYPSGDTVVIEIQVNGTLRFLVRNSTSNEMDCYTTDTILLNAWTHVFCVKVLGRLYIFLNGKQAATISGSLTIDLSLMDTVNIAQSGRNYDGALAEIAVYTDDKTVHDALQHYLIARRFGNNFAGQIYRTNPKWWYRLSEDPIGSLFAQDEMTNNTGTYSNAPTLGIVSALPVDQFTTATNFNGSNQKITLNGTANNFGASDFSMGVWCKSSVFASQEFCTNYNGSTGWLYGIKADGTVGMDGRWLAGNYQSFNSVALVNDGLWHFVMMVHTGVTVELWIDGVLDSVHTTLANGCTSNQNIVMGTYGNSPQFWMNGDLHDMTFYDRRVTMDEIVLMHKQGLGIEYEDYDDVILNDGPVAYWKMDDQTTTMTDSSPNGFHGTHNIGVLLGQVPAFPDSTSSVYHNVTDSVGPTDVRFENAVFSQSVWVSPDVLSMTNYSYIVGQQVGTTGSKFALTMSSYGPGGINGHARLWITQDGNDASFIGVDSTITMAAGLWYNFVIVYDGVHAKLYCNGEFDIQFLVTSPVTSVDPIRFGNAYTGATSLYGRIDMAAYFNYPLTPTQIHRHYKMAEQTFIKKPTYSEAVLQSLPIHYWRMDELSTTETDLIDGANTGRTDRKRFGPLSRLDRKSG